MGWEIRGNRKGHRVFVPDAEVEERLKAAGIEVSIKPCPFCGKPPETMPSGEGERGLMIECITQGCVNPHTSYYDHASAIATWNARA